MGNEPPKYPQFAELLAQHMKAGTGRSADLRARPWSTAEIAKKLGCSDKTVGNYQRGQSRPLPDQLHVLLNTVFGLIPINPAAETQVMRDDANALRIAAGYGDGLVVGLPAGGDPIKPPSHLADRETGATQLAPVAPQPAASRSAEFDSSAALQSALNKSRDAMAGAVLGATATDAARPKDTRSPSEAPKPGFPKYPANIEQRLSAVIADLTATCNQAEGGRRHGVAADLTAGWLKSTLDSRWSAETSVFELYSSLTLAVEQASKQQQWADVPQAAIESDKSMLLQVAKRLFALVWTEAAFLTFRAAPVVAHTIESDDLLYAGQSAALGFDFELPHSPTLIHWRLDIGGEIQSGVGRDKEQHVLEWLAQQFEMQACPLGAVQVANWRTEVVAKAEVRQRRFRRARVLAAKLPSDQQALIDEIHKLGDSLKMLTQVRTGTPGNYLRQQASPEAVLRSEIEDFLMALDRMAPA